MKHIVETKLQITRQIKYSQNIRDFDMFSYFDLAITFLKRSKMLVDCYKDILMK